MITSTVVAFSLEYIKNGHLVLVFNNQNQLLGSGVVTEVKPLELRVSMHFHLGREHRASPRNFEDEMTHDFGDLTAYTIEISQVNSKELQLFIIDPLGYIIGNENAPVSY